MSYLFINTILEFVWWLQICIQLWIQFCDLGFMFLILITHSSIFVDLCISQWLTLMAWTVRDPMDLWMIGHQEVRLSPFRSADQLNESPCRSQLIENSRLLRGRDRGKMYGEEGQFEDEWEVWLRMWGNEKRKLTANILYFSKFKSLYNLDHLKDSHSRVFEALKI